MEVSARCWPDTTKLATKIKGIDSVESDTAVIAELAQLSDIAYERRRKDAAKALGIPANVLDRAVRRAKVQAEKAEAALPHWRVEPWPDPVNCAEPLSDIKKVFKRYIVLPKGADDALALWTLHAWTMDAGD